MMNEVYNDMYNKAFKNNAFSIFLYKSNRKNSKCSDAINVNHLISKDIKISDEKIINQFIDIIEKVVYQSLKYNKHLELSCWGDYGKNSSYSNPNSYTYKTTEYMRFHWERQTFFSIEQCINFLYSVFCLIYPYNEINLENGIYKNESIKYYINKYYHNDSI